jgi:hypothetical protein
MPLFDKVKAQAAQVAQKAQEAGRAGQARLEDVQAKKKLDGLYRSLGAAVYAQRAGRGGPDTAAEIERLYSELAEFEATHGNNAMSAPAEGSGQSGVAEGDFKL